MWLTVLACMPFQARTVSNGGNTSRTRFFTREIVGGRSGALRPSVLFTTAKGFNVAKSVFRSCLPTPAAWSRCDRVPTAFIGPQTHRPSTGAMRRYRPGSVKDVDKLKD